MLPTIRRTSELSVDNIIFLLSLAGLAGCASSAEYSLRGHLREAIDLNESRRSRYAELAMDHRPAHDLRKQPEAVSDLLIKIEKKAILASYIPTWFWKGLNFDRAARKYQMAGIPIIHEDLISMENIPVIQLYERPFPVLEQRYQGRSEYDFDGKELTDFESVANVLEQEIEHLSDEPRFNCMLRHGLESAARIARHAPIYIDLARMKGLSSPEKLLWKLLRSHFWAIEDAMEIDRRAAPLQARGIPIVCNDVPSIPAYSERVLQIYEDMGGTL